MLRMLLPRQDASKRRAARIPGAAPGATALRLLFPGTFYFPMSPGARLVFDRFELNADGTDLRGPSGPLAVTPKALAVLAYLAARPGQLVSKRELLDEVWQGVFVADGALKVCVREIRRALDDDARAPRFIETAHRRGYRFVAPVTRSAAGTAADVPVTAAPVVPVHYARSGDVSIAYQVLGDGPDRPGLRDGLGLASRVLTGASRRSPRFLRRLARFSRLILFDKRGTGLSDPAHRDADARAAHGRRAGGARRRRLAPRGAARRVRGRPDVQPVRRHLPRAHRRAGR